MSRLTYSKKISELLKNRIEALDNIDTNTFFDNDELFLFAECLTYMVLSKEEIIDKDYKNNDNIDRLEINVHPKEIAKVFSKGFAPEMPIIYNGLENDLLWVLDNFRDSISHEMFEIDENSKVIRINNTQGNRLLRADIPFSWFIAYAKNDIANSIEATSDTISGVFYNKKLLNENSFNTEECIDKTIVYNVEAVSKSGKPFNKYEIEQAIKNIFHGHSMMDSSESNLNSFKELARDYEYSDKYDQRYLQSYLYSTGLIAYHLNRDYPDIEFNISIDENKTALKSNNNLKDHYTNYSIMCNEFNRLIDPKEIGLIRYLIQLIESSGKQSFIDYNSKNKYERMAIFASMFMGSYKITSDKDVEEWFNQNYPLLQTLLISIMGMNTLVMNTTKYNEEYKDKNPNDYVLNAQIKKPFIDFASKRKSLNMSLLQKKIDLMINEQNKNNCEEKINSLNLDLATNEKRINGMKKAIKSIDSNIEKNKDSITNIEKELHSIATYISSKYNFGYNQDELAASVNLITTISELKKMFQENNDIEQKENIRKQIGGLYDQLNALELEYCYIKNYNMEEVMNLMRNCFPHVGRINLTKDSNGEVLLHMTDYDNDKSSSGEVIIKKDKLIEMICEPLKRSFKVKA